MKRKKATKFTNQQANNYSHLLQQQQEHKQKLIELEKQHLLSELRNSQLVADQRREVIKQQIMKRREAIRSSYLFAKTNLKAKRVIGVYKPAKKLTDSEILENLKIEREKNKRNYSLSAIRKHERSFLKRIEKRERSYKMKK